MTRKSKKTERARNNPEGVKYDDFCRIIELYGFVLRSSKGSHRTYELEGVPELVTIQPRKCMARPYQVRNFFKIVDINELIIIKGEEVDE